VGDALVRSLQRASGIVTHRAADDPDRGPVEVDVEVEGAHAPHSGAA
jgi:hypothetical protein